MKKWLKITFKIIVVLFALIGLFFTGTYLAMELKLTNDSGRIDSNDRYFHENKDKYNQSFKRDTSSFKKNDFEALHRILILNRYYPKNAEMIFHAYCKSNNEVEALRMIDAADIYLKENAAYMAEVKDYLGRKKTADSVKTGSIFDWMNIMEWSDLKVAVEKDKALIDSVSKLTGVEARLIVCALIGEQIRLFNSKREAYKRWIGPLKILSVESKFSLGVTGIKEHTARRIEQCIKDSTSKFYLGKQYEHLLDFQTDSVDRERFQRLTSFRSHYYSYMYAALFIKQMKVQWERAGFPIDNRPEILATLFNVGYEQSIPKANPRVGGSGIKIEDKMHSFGAIAYEFYYSGEMYDLFPYQPKKFDWNAE
ncbi:MAG: hypothetical protein ACKOXB_00135 [Flavobacteriales bacterium]